MDGWNVDTTIENGFKTEFSEPLDADTTLLVPVGMHPVRLSPWNNQPESWAQEIGLPLDPGAAWNRVWAHGTGRGPWQGGTLHGYEISYAMGIRYELLTIGKAKYWVPRSARDEEMDSAAEWEQIAKSKWAHLWEHMYFEAVGLAGHIPEDYGEDRLKRVWKEAGRTESDDEEEEEPRELSPAEPGRMEERGFMTWTAGITVGEV
jgi:hypothetical protein